MLIKKHIIDYIFWSLLILFTNPGGIQQALGIYDLRWGLNFNDLLFVVLFLLFMLVPQKFSLCLPSSRKIRTYLFYFSVYYFIIFGYITPFLRNIETNVLFNLIKLRFPLYSIVIFIMFLTFWRRSSYIFIKLLLSSSIIVLILFILTIITGKEILPITNVSRKIVDADRNLLLNYGIMYILTPIGISCIIFKFRSRLSYFFIIAMVLLNVAWVLSLTRRHIFGFFIYIIIAYTILFYVNRTNPIALFVRSLRVVIYSIVIIFILKIFFPSYLQAGEETVRRTIEMLLIENEDERDERLSLVGRKSIMLEFYKHPLLGTGFSNLWRTKEGDKIGYEASDYPFQAALAMTGIIGCLAFLPIYYIILLCIIRDLKFLKKNNLHVNSKDKMILIGILLYFIYNLLQYMNWFGPVSNMGNVTWYIALAIYISVRETYYRSFIQKLLRNE